MVKKHAMEEKRCEFCMGLSPIVYCKADAAHLCLSCDAKVHSANALSYRHDRTLVCMICRYQPAHVQCFDHRMFMCQSCDTIHHVSNSQHRKKVITCYVGCPSAKDLAALWGFDLNEFNHVCNESEEGSSSRGMKVVKDDKRRQNNHSILQQIFDLKRLQLSEGVIDSSCSVHVEERNGGLPFKHETMDYHMDQFDGNILEFHDTNSTLDDKNEEPLSSPFSELDNLTSSGNSLHGADSFWQYKSPAHNNEIWFQNMQDLGVCDEVLCFDDVNIPDVDLTFRNFEEIFGSEHEPNRALVDDKDMLCSFADKHPSFCKLHIGCESTIEQSLDIDYGIDTSGQINQSKSIHYLPRPIRPSYLAAPSSSFSLSRISGESSVSEYKDDGLSPTPPKQLSPHGSFDSKNTKIDDMENVFTRYKEKKVLRHEKQSHCTTPKSKSDFKKRGKGQLLKVEEGERASVDRSF